MFERLVGQIGALQKKEELLRKLAQKIEPTGGFDDEDKTVIDKEIKHLQADLTRLQTELKHKKDIYDLYVVAIEQKIQNRTATLNMVKDFDHFPDLLQFFATKQNKLQDGLQAVKEQLST